jgi:hypothetical protein
MPLHVSERQDDLPLPRRIWWPWDERAASVGFERRFTLSPDVAAASLYVTVSGVYRLWLDGEAVALPAAELPLWRVMQRIPLVLSGGEHRLSIEAAPGDHGQPFLMACLDGVVAGSPVRLVTDARWSMCREPEDGWAARGADGAAWRPAWAFDGVWAEPWGMPCNAPDDFCRLTTGRQVMHAEALTEVVTCYPGLRAGGGRARCRTDGSLVMEPVLPFARTPPPLPVARQGLEWYRAREVHSRINNSWLGFFDRRMPHVILDAGAETFARVQLGLHTGGPAVLAVTTGESRQEVDRYDRRVTDIVTLRDGERFTTAPTGFRYVKVTALSAGRAGEHLVLDPVTVQHIRHDAAVRGDFACSDDLLNAIWATSVRTLDLCMQNEIWDGIKRDQLPWMGDLYVEALVAYHVYGDADLARRSLAVLGDLGPAPPRALAAQVYPGLQAIWQTAGGDINDIPSYTLWWLVGLGDYLRYTGDLSLLEDLAEALAATVAHIAARVEADGVWRARAGWDFVDWAPLTATEREIFTHLLACQVLALSGKLLQTLAAGGRSVDAPLGRYAAARRRMVAAARDRWWAGGSGILGSRHHLAAMAIRSGVFGPDESRALFDRALAADPPSRMTYWHRYADLDAAARVGRIGWGLDYVRRHWGAAVRAGVTTFWETMDAVWLEDEDPHAMTMVGGEYARYGGYETSLCHGWSAGPAAWLHRAVLGVRPAADGFTALEFEPALGDLAWARGTVPTPLGDVEVELRRDPGGRRAALTVPAGIAVNVADGVDSAWHVEVVRRS